MEPHSMLQPELVGREEELAALSRGFSEAVAGRGSAFLVSGEAGIGKTRLVTELLSRADAEGAMLVKGWCLPEAMEPLMPVKEALKGCGMRELISGTPPPRVLSAFLLNDAGMLFARAERTRTGMDADIFAAMLNAVSSFVTDSLRMMGESGQSGSFSSISHSGYRILVQATGRFSLAVVAEGEEDEFLIGEMGKILADVDGKVDPGQIDMSGFDWIEARLMKLVTSPRYDGAFVADDPRLRQENLYDNILMGLQRASGSRPLVMFLDDLQWADPSTLGLLHYLARNTRSDRVFILGTYRPEDVMPGPDGAPHVLETAMQDMSRESLFTEIRLKRLGQDGTDHMIDRVLGNSELPRDLYARIHRETDGNPFFVLELLRMLADEGAIGMANGRWTMEGTLDCLNLPSKIFDVVQRRLNRLPGDQYDILECASVVGERFGSDVVGLAMDMNRIPLLKKLNEIERVHRLIRPADSKYRFDHCKIRDVLYGNISGELRREYHLMVARSYGQLFRGREAEIAGELAHHYLEAGDARASGHLLVAADRAMQDYANEEAIRYYRLALDRVTSRAERERILECLGDLHAITGDCDRAIAMFRDAMGLTSDIIRKSDLLAKVSRAFEKHSEYDRGIEAAQAGLDILEGKENPARLRLLSAISLNHVKKGEYDTTMGYLEQQLEGASRLDEKRLYADAHRLMGIVWWFRGNFEKALEHYHAALPVQKDIGDVRGMESTLNNIGVVYMETGRLDEALEYFMEGLEYEETVGDKSGMASGIDNIGNVLHTKGDAGKALEYHLRGLELYRMNGDRNGEAWALSSLGYVYMDLGLYDKSIECQLESIRICKEIGDQHIIIYDYYGLADSHRVLGRFGDALEYVNLANSLARELDAKREIGATTYVLGTIQRDMGEFRPAMENFALAREMLEEVGDTTMLTMIDYDQGKCLAMSGDVDGGRALLEKARVAFEGFGMGIWLKQAEAALAKL